GDVGRGPDGIEALKVGLGDEGQRLAGRLRLCTRRCQSRRERRRQDAAPGEPPNASHPMPPTSGSFDPRPPHLTPSATRRNSRDRTIAPSRILPDSDGVSRTARAPEESAVTTAPDRELAFFSATQLIDGFAK